MSSGSRMRDDTVQTVSQMVDALKAELERRPKGRHFIQEAIDELTVLMESTDGEAIAEKLLESIGADLARREADGDDPQALPKIDTKQEPNSADAQKIEKSRPAEPFDRLTYKLLLSMRPEQGQSLVNELVHRALTEHAGNDSNFIEREFSRLVSRYEDVSLRDKALEGGFGYLADGDRHFIQTSFDETHAAWQNDRRFILFIKDRLNESTDSLHPPSVVERTERLAAYASAHGNVGLEDYARLLFPEWSIFQNAELPAPSATVELPSKAPEIYQGLRGPETPPAFVQRVYGEWLGHGLTRAHIRKLDPVLYTAMNNWLKKPDCEWPAEVDLPTLKEQNTRDIQALREGAPVNVTLQEMRRLQGAIQRRDEGRAK